MNLTKAANSLHMTKGALSYQINQLEQYLGFDVFLRQHGGIGFTVKGEELYHLMAESFEKIEQNIRRLQSEDSDYLTVGMTTYFASRWLTPRLMRFTSENPDIRLRIQPVMGEVELSRDQIDLAIQWGDGEWSDRAVEPLFNCPAFPTAGKKTWLQIQKSGLKESLEAIPLLHDFDQSTSWKKWLHRASIEMEQKSNSLVIPDPNVRVEAVKNDQGIALNDALVSAEINAKTLFPISDISLEEFGYFLSYKPDTLKSKAFESFRFWILEEAAEYRIGE